MITWKLMQVQWIAYGGGGGIRPKKAFDREDGKKKSHIPRREVGFCVDVPTPGRRKPDA
jgi:hypothetical protein